MAELLIGLLGVAAFPAVMDAWSVDIGDDRDQLTAMVWRLIDSDPGACLVTIRKLMASDDQAKRSAGIWALGSTFTHVGISAEDYGTLDAAAGDTDANLRAITLGTLSGLKQDRSYAWLVAGLADPDTQVRVSALSGLGFSGRPEAVEAIAPLAGDDHPRVRLFVAESLRCLAYPAGLPVAMSLAEDHDAAVRSAALRTIGALDSPPAVYIPQ